LTTDRPNEVGPLNADWSAILLTGGAGTRMGREKSGVVLGDFTLVDHVLRGLPTGVEVIVVGPVLQEPPRPVTCTRESPVGGGPVAGLAAGLDLVTTQIACVIATDMPFAGGLLSHLTHRIPEGADALVPVDATGLRQPLCAAYRTTALRTAVKALGEVQDASMRSLLDHLVVAEITLTELVALHDVSSLLDPNSLLDIDTPSDLDRSRAIMLETKGRAHE
jgi:molybdopterin-guanine dinucleotide biosynthesis protein A